MSHVLDAKTLLAGYDYKAGLTRSNRWLNALGEPALRARIAGLTRSESQLNALGELA
jgi:hypothetical protein